MVNLSQNGKNDHHRRREPSPAGLITSWGSFWHTMRRVIRGELQLQWVETDHRPAASAPTPDRPQPEAAGGSPAPPANGAGPAPSSDSSFDPAESGQVLMVYCLGSFRPYQNDRAIEKWPGRKVKSIFKYLLFHRERPLNMEILMELFWDGVEPAAARKSLHQAIYLLRQTLQTDGPEVAHILSEDSCYFLNPDLEVWIDSDAFTQHYAAGQSLEHEGRLVKAIAEYEAADSLYRGEFLAEDRYEDWPTLERERLKEANLDLLDRLSRYYVEQNQPALAITYCQKILAEDNCREDAHRLLMRCYWQQGQPHLALRQFHLCVEALEQELEVPPMPATAELYRQIQKNRSHFLDR